MLNSISKIGISNQYFHIYLLFGCVELTIFNEKYLINIMMTMKREQECVYWPLIHNHHQIRGSSFFVLFTNGNYVISPTILFLSHFFLT